MIRMPVENPARHILVVDDDEAVRSFAARVLQEAGYDVVLAKGGREALELAEQHRFDQLVIDLAMPHMRGDELARRLRTSGIHAKVLYLTGFSDELFKQKSVLMGDEAFVDKPVTIQGLLEAVSLLQFGHLHGPKTPTR
jgi:two-component system cell cycle sensor histidine kinase/response regulator CckA